MLSVLCQELVAVAGVGVASLPGARWRSSVQRHSGQPLLGPDVGLLRQQVKAQRWRTFNPAYIHLCCFSPPSLRSTLQVRHRPVQIRGASRGLGADSDAGAGGGSQEVQRSERGPRSGPAQAPQPQGPLSDLRAQRQRCVPAACRHRLGGKYSILLRGRG